MLSTRGKNAMSDCMQIKLTLALLLLTYSQYAQCQRHQSTIETEVSLNLNSILVQQGRLSQECRRLESIRLAQLERLLDFEQSNKQWLHLNEQEHSIELPAVCLLVNGPPGASTGQRSSADLRLDLVNWIFDPEELAAKFHNASVKRNRIARQVNDAEALPVDLLSNYLFDVNSFKNDIQQTSSEQTEGQKFTKQYLKLMEDERYTTALGPISERVRGYISPVILVPGLGGSRLQARFKKQQRVNIICNKQSDWQDFWLTLRWLLPVAIDCWIDNARLVFDPVSGFAQEPPGVESRVPDFGSINSVRHLDLRSPKLTKYFDSIIERYLLLGYQADKNLFAAPYDFRLAPQQLEQTFFQDLRQLIDEAHSSNSQQKVTLVCHSMGCTNLLYFLKKQSPAWRQAKVRKLIAISSPWGGSIKALKALLVGDQFGLPIGSDSKFKKLARTYPSVAYLLPQVEVFGRPNKYQVDAKSGGPTLVQTPQRTYNVGQLEELLDDAQMSLQWNWFKRTIEELKPLEPLADLHVDCLHSLNIPTSETIIFRNQTDFPDGSYEMAYGDGDGTVNHQSLLVCADWAAKLPGRVKHKIVKNTSHSGMLTHEQVLDHITSDVTMKSQDSELENEV